MLCEEMNNVNKKSGFVGLIDFRVLSQIQVSKEIKKIAHFFLKLIIYVRGSCYD